jgi:AI-2 transport protein TqsA
LYMDSTIKTMVMGFSFVLLLYLMSVLSSILVPLVLAFLLASLFQPIIIYLKKKKVPKWFIMPLVGIITLIVLFGVFQVIFQTYNEITNQQDFLLARISQKFDAILSWLNYVGKTYFHTRINVKKLSSLWTIERISAFAGGIAASLSSFTGSFVMFLLYYFVLLGSMSNYERFLKYVGGGRANELLIGYEGIQKSIISYITYKTLINLINGALVYLICLLFGVKFAFFWGFLTFMLNFIPTIGSVLVVFFPSIMGIIQFDEFKILLFFILSIISVQFAMLSLVEPIIIGNKLRLNTLTVIFGLVFWGYLWGIAGMILSVPLMVIIKLVFEQTGELSFIGRVMGSSEM